MPVGAPPTLLSLLSRPQFKKGASRDADVPTHDVTVGARMEEEARLPPPHSTSQSDGKVLRRAFRFSVATAMLSWKLQLEALGGRKRCQGQQAALPLLRCPDSRDRWRRLAFGRQYRVRGCLPRTLCCRPSPRSAALPVSNFLELLYRTT